MHGGNLGLIPITILHSYTLSLKHVIEASVSCDDLDEEVALESLFWMITRCDVLHHITGLVASDRLPSSVDVCPTVQ